MAHTSLLQAIESDDDDIGVLRTLVRDATPLEKDIALSHAVERGKEAIVQLLLDNGAYENALDHRFDADEQEQEQEQEQEEGILDRSQLRDLDRSQFPPRMSRVLHLAYDKGHVGIVRLLMNAGANITMVRPFSQDQREEAEEIVEDGWFYNRTIVSHAILTNDYGMLSFLKKEHGWNVNTRINRVTPLSLACLANNDNMITYLIELGANVDMISPMANGKHISPIDMCIKNCNRQMLRLLMRNNADINANISLEFAIQKYMEKVRIRHLQHPQETVLHIDPNDPEDKKSDGDELKRSRGIIRDILDYTVDFGFTVLDDRHKFFYITDFALVKRREEMNDLPDVIKQLVNDYQHRQTVEFLATLDTSAVNLQDEYKRTALHRAMKNGQLEAVKYLILTKNASEDLSDMWGRTASECLVATYWDMKMKIVDPDFFPIVGFFKLTPLIHVYERQDRLGAFQCIGRFIAKRREFLQRLGPRLRRPFVPSDIVRNFANYIFS
jgi:ankyrin repeat protein